MNGLPESLPVMWPRQICFKLAMEDGRCAWVEPGDSRVVSPSWARLGSCSMEVVGFFDDRRHLGGEFVWEQAVIGELNDQDLT